MQIRWSPEAAADLESIVRHIRQDNSAAARQVAKTIYDGVSALKDFPNRGRIGRVQGSRELVLAPLPYIVVYRVKEHLEVAHIYHAAQNWSRG